MWKLLFYLSAVAQRSAVWSACAARNNRAFPLSFKKKCELGSHLLSLSLTAVFIPSPSSKLSLPVPDVSLFPHPFFSKFFPKSG